MNDPWLSDQTVPARRCGVSRTLFSMLLVVGAATAVYHLDPVGRAAYAVMRGKLNAEREYLATVNPEHVAQLDQISRAFHLVAEVIKPSVVSIRSSSSRNAPNDDTHSRMRRFFGAPPPVRETNVGSGVVYDEQGHIVTSNHVIAGGENISVELADGRSFDAKIVGRDRMTDLALLKINASRLHPASFGDSDAVEVGHVVLAVGSPFRLSQTVSHGIISAKGRQNVGLDIDYQDFIQTDCPINPGNSGGPLVNTRGQVIGINTAIATDSGSFSGIGFATPSNKVAAIAKVLKSGKNMIRGYLGVAIGNLDEATAKKLGLDDADGVLIGEIAEDGPADKGGLKAGDVIQTIDGKPVHTSAELQDIIAGTSPGTKRTFSVSRKGSRKELKIAIGEQPANFSTRGGLPLRRPPADEEDRNQPVDKDAYISTLGVEVRAVTPQLLKKYNLADVELNHGVLITRVEPGSLAVAMKLTPGMVIVSAARQPVSSAADLRATLTAEALEDGVRLRLLDAEGEHIVRVQK